VRLFQIQLQQKKQSKKALLLHLVALVAKDYVELFDQFFELTSQ